MAANVGATVLFNGKPRATASVCERSRLRLAVKLSAVFQFTSFSDNFT